MTITRTSTKELHPGGYRLRDFTASNFTTAFKVRSDQVVQEDPPRFDPVNGERLDNVTITDGTISNVFRVLDMTENAGRLDGFELRGITASVRSGFSRLRRASNGLFEDCHVRGEGNLGPNASDDLPAGFATSDLPTSHITYRRCSATGFYSKLNSDQRYWNGDGGSDEEQDTFMVYEDCEFFDNADGGLDTKSQGVVVTRLRSWNNHRNLRLWGNGTITDLLSTDPRSAHIWIGGGSRLGDYTIERPVFVGGSTRPHIQIDSGTAGATITVIDPVVPEGETLRVVQKDSGRDVTVNVIYTQDESACDERVAAVTAASAEALAIERQHTADARATVNAAKVRLEEIASATARAPGGSSDKSTQIARVHEMAVTPLST